MPQYGHASPSQQSTALPRLESLLASRGRPQSHGGDGAQQSHGGAGVQLSEPGAAGLSLPPPPPPTSLPAPPPPALTQLSPVGQSLTQLPPVGQSLAQLPPVGPTLQSAYTHMLRKCSHLEAAVAQQATAGGPGSDLASRLLQESVELQWELGRPG